MEDKQERMSSSKCDQAHTIVASTLPMVFKVRDWELPSINSYKQQILYNIVCSYGNICPAAQPPSKTRTACNLAAFVLHMKY